MRNIPVIKITPEELQKQISTLEYATGGEAVICKTDEIDTLDKYFVDPTTRKVTYMSENKQRKIEKLFQMDLDEGVKPHSIICSAGTIVGYRMIKPRGYMPLEKAVLTRKQKVVAIKNSQKALETFAKHDIAYVDIKADNILVNPKTSQIMYCDMDNVRLKEYDVDLKSRDVMRIFEVHGELDELVVAYNHNLLTLQQLGFKEEIPEYFSDILLSIKRGPFPTGFKQTAIPIIEQMPYPEQFQGKYLAKHIKR